MELRPVNTSVVVVALAHNPSILHPSFLGMQGIVPDTWKYLDPVICTPALSMVNYDNGVTFRVEREKLQILDAQAGKSQDVSASEIPQLASRYVEKLPHEPYTAVGINFTSLIELANPEQLLIRQFLTGGPWNSEKLQPLALGLRFVYPAQDARLRLSCDAGNVTQPPDQEAHRGLLVSANYHTDLSSGDRMKSAMRVISRFTDRYVHFQTLARTIFGLEA